MSFIQIQEPTRLSLSTSGVIGLLGGDDAVSAMDTIHFYRSRRWLGWYNTPGSFQVAKHLGSIAKLVSSKLSQTSLDTKSTTSLELDDCRGPKFRAAHSGTVIEETGPLAVLLTKECAALDLEGIEVQGRRTTPITVTIADLGQAPASEMRPAYSSPLTILLASLPVAVSIGTCAQCALHEDWYASSLILIGIIASGVSSLAFGAADFVFTHPEPAKGSPAGDGILGSDGNLVLLRGTEGVVNAITRGRFSLRFSSASVRLIHWCSLLFYIQCIAQLLLIPQASLFGQFMFLASLGTSALYNALLSSQDKEKIHRQILFEKVLENPTVAKYTLGTRTTAVVFALLVLQPRDPTKLLDALLPNDTEVWKKWKGAILEQLRHPHDQPFMAEVKLVDVDESAPEEQDLLHTLYGDARAAYNGYKQYLQSDAL